MATNIRSQFEFMPLEEERLLRIKAEFQTTVSGIQSAMILAISNYDKKSNDYDSLLIQLNAERNKTKSLEMQLVQLKNSLKQKDAKILELQLGVSNQEAAVGRLNKKIENPSEIEKKTCDFEVKLQNILRRYGTTSTVKNIPYNVEQKKTKNEEQNRRIDDGLKISDNDLNRDAIKSKLDHNQKSKVHSQMESKDKGEWKMKVLSKKYLTIELNRIIGENRAIIDGLKKVQQT